MPPASPRSRCARFPFIRLKALAPLELAVRLKTLRQGLFARIIQIMSNREKPVRHNPGWLSDVSLRHYRNVPHSENRVIQYRSLNLLGGGEINEVTLKSGWHCSAFTTRPRLAAVRCAGGQSAVTVFAELLAKTSFAALTGHGQMASLDLSWSSQRFTRKDGSHTYPYSPSSPVNICAPH
jgi:hypothetical protein